MKRTLFTLLCTLLLAVSALAQSKAAQIADLQNQINAIEQSYGPMQDRLTALKTDQDNNKFAWDAYKKANDQYKADIAAFNPKMDEANRAAQLLKPSIDNLNQRMDAHNNNRCTETNHDGSCAWYDREAQQLNAQSDQLAAAKAQVRQQFAALAPESQRLDQVKAQLITIYNQAVANDDKWQASMQQLKTEFLAAQARENELKRELAVLQGDKDACFTAIPKRCSEPQLGPDGKPILDTECERMVAKCRGIFDGSKP